MPTLIAASTNRVYYTPDTYPLDTLTLSVERDDVAVAIGGSVQDDATNERYYIDLQSSECVVGMYRFAWLLSLDTSVRTDVEYAECVEVEPGELIATPTDLRTYGYADGDSMLVRAAARVKAYLRPRASAIPVFDGTYPEPLVELVCSIAYRLASTPDAVTQGVRNEQAGGEQVTWGADAYAGTSSLTSAEMTALDRMYPRMPHTINLDV